MATNNFTFKLTTQDGDGNTSSENVSVNSGPSESSPPTVTFVFPSGARAEAGDGVDPFWSAGTNLASVYCKVFPTARPDSGGNGEFLVQYYSTAAKHPNSPDRRFAVTHEGVGGQLSADLSNIATNYMTVSSGIGITGSGLCQSSDLVGFRKAIQITTDAASTIAGTRVTRFGRTERIAGRNISIGEYDEGIAAYHHDITNNRVYTLERGNRGHGRILKEWTAGTNVNLHPYHYTPMYENAGAFDLLAQPHIMVSEVGGQYPLTGSMSVTGTAVVGTNTDFVNEISGGGAGNYHVSGATNLIKFKDAEDWYIISGVLSSSGLTIYDYGDSLALTNQPAEVNAYTLGSGTVAIMPDVTGCLDWDVRITPQHETGNSVSSLSIDYTATIEATTLGGAISGTPSYSWEVDISGVSTTPVWSGLVPGNLATQTVVYTRDVAKRIRVTVSGAGQPACKHQYDTGDLSLIEGISAGTWKSVQTTAVGYGGQVESKIRAELVGSRQSGKYYHHHLTAMKPKQTKTTAGVSIFSTSISVTAGTIDTWPNKGTCIVKGLPKSSTFWNSAKNQYFRFSYTGKTNNTLTGISNRRIFEMPVTKPYDQRGMGLGTSLLSIPAGADIWIQQVQPHPFTTIEAVTAPNKVRLRDVAGIGNGSSVKWVRFMPAWHDLAYGRSRGGKMIDQPYRITVTNAITREITLDRNLDSAIAANMFCVMQPYTDQVAGNLYPTSVDQNRLNFLNTAAWMVYSPNNSFTGISSTGNTGGTLSTASDGVTVTTTISNELYIWDPMQNIMAVNNHDTQKWRLPPVGRMVIPDGNPSSTKGFVIEYNGTEGPIHYTSSFNFHGINGVLGDRPGIFKLKNVKVVSELSHHVHKSWNFGSRTLLVPYQDVDMTPLSIVTFELTDNDVGYSFNGGTSRHLGWSQPLADEVFVTNSSSLTQTGQDMVTIPVRTNYESQHYSDFPNPAIRSAPPVFINQPVSEIEGAPGDSSYNGDVLYGGCIHYDAIVEIWNGESYDDVKIRDVEIGQLIRTPEGPKEVLNRLESRHGHTRIINVRDGRTVHCTHVHPIATVRDDGVIVWKKAAFVEQGSTVMTDSGPQTVDSNIALEFTGRTIHPFYDLSVADVHQFFANGILVHNKMKLPPYE